LTLSVSRSFNISTFLLKLNSEKPGDIVCSDKTGTSSEKIASLRRSSDPCRGTIPHAELSEQKGHGHRKEDSTR
jgi:hypothetical protein